MPPTKSPTRLTPVRYILPLFSAFAIYAIFHFAAINGLRGLAKEWIACQTLPESNEILRTVYTGVESVDRILTTLITFFWSALDGSNASLALHSVCFAGAFGSAWVLVTLEAWRKGNAWTITAFPWIFGVTSQLATFAFATPLYFALQLWTPNTSSQPTVQAIAIPKAVLKSIPLIFILGYIIPSVLTILPAPQVVSFDQKQILIAFWQPWPVYVSIATTFVHFLLSSSSVNEKQNDPRALRKALRPVYFFAFTNAAIGHVVAWTVSIASAIVPVIFNEEFVNALHPRQVFGTHLPFKSQDLRVKSVAEGVHIFLQWDFLIGSFAVLLWAITLHVLAHRQIKGVDWIGLVAKVGSLVLLVGPVATAVELIWERDELVLGEGIKDNESRQGLK